MSQAIEQAIVELAWRQWTALGVAGVASPPESAIDLEAVLALTPSIAYLDPRLADEVDDWYAAMGPRFVSVSRLRQVRRLMPAAKIADFPWLAHGREYKRPARRSGKSRGPRLELPALVQLRSRYVFGLGARADVLFALAVAGPTEPRRITDLMPTGYTKQAIATVLDELAQVGVLSKYTSRSHASYQLEKSEPLHALLAPLPARMPPWAERFAVVAHILHTWQRYGTRTTYVVELAKTLASLTTFAPSTGPMPAARGITLAQVDAWVLGFLTDGVGL